MKQDINRILVKQMPGRVKICPRYANESSFLVHNKAGNTSSLLPKVREHNQDEGKVAPGVP